MARFGILVKRRVHQVVKIGEDVMVHVVNIERGAVTLGIVAPGQEVRREDALPEEPDTDASSQRT